MKMKILFVTYASANGRGGHLHSMLHISDFISGFYDTKVLSLGNGDSCVLKASKNYIGSCIVSDVKSIVKLDNQLSQKLESFLPDIIHCFDEYAFFLCIHSKKFRSAKFVFTKCGGPSSPNNYWFYADNIVLFSAENYKWYQNKKQYKKANIQLIPNRVNELMIGDLLPHGIKRNENTFYFMRIGRIGINYKSSILSLLGLVDTLQNAFSIQRKLVVYIIGVIENDIIFQEIKEVASERRVNVCFITDERTIHASQFLSLADCVLGTGRGLMEAMSLKIPVLTPVVNNQFPVLVTNSNFNDFLESNFSPRNYISNINKEEELHRIKEMINNEQSFNTIKNETYTLFKSRLSIDSTEDKYKRLYADTLSRKKTYHLINSIYLIKYIIQHLWM
ncbi:MAG: hypothetical protein RBT56_14775 [Ignavibacteriaceae bacterium]|nr:hypothetical protein [Ignavibacteriaceae bacterium]